jgi:hypothetical protein
MKARRRSAAGRTVGLLLTLAATARAQAQTPAPAPSPAPAPAAAESRKVVPYGVLYFNGFGNSAATNNGDVPLWATAGPASAGASARQSRFGFRITGLSAGGAKLSGVVEADFFGGFPSIGIGDNMGVLRLRLASARIDWERTTLVVGQDWMVFAPGNPVSLACAGIPLMAASGNPWARLPQVRLERRAGAMTLQGAVLAPSTGDFSSAFLYQPASGGLSRWPFLQGRAALSTQNARGTGKPAVLGISGHYGRAKVAGTADAEVASSGVAGDFSFPVVSRVTLAGKAFAGRNLAGFQAGVFQGLNPDYGVPGPAGPVLVRARAIGTRGGWAQLAATAIPEHLGLYATYGIDDPRDEDLVSVTRRDWRLRNRSYALSLINNVTAQLAWGIEVRREETKFRETGTRRNTHLNLAMTLTF